VDVDGIAGQLLLVAALVLLNAVFAGSEIALISLREGQLERLERRSRAGRALGELAREPNRFLSTIQIGITLAGFLASAAAAITLAEPLVEPLSGPLGRAARPTAVFVVTAALTFVTLVLGELAPKRLAMQRAERWALVVARPIGALATLATPLVWVLSKATDGVVRLFGGDPARDRQEVTDEEVRDLIASGEVYEGYQRQVIEGALEVADRTLREVVTPRPDVVGMSSDTSAADGLRLLADAGHSRAPVWQNDLDDAEAYVSALSLVGVSGRVGDHAESTVVLPESVHVLDALWRMQAERRQLALVVSEHGAVEGIVSVEDLVEEIVGEIYDEHDRDLVGVVHHDDGAIDLPGRFPLHDLVGLGIATPESEQTTVGGLLAEHHGRLPVEGDRMPLDGYEVEVTTASRRTVRRVRLHPVEHDDDGQDGRGEPDGQAAH
jgi:putative hemolysin